MSCKKVLRALSRVCLYTVILCSISIPSNLRAQLQTQEGGESPHGWANYYQQLTQDESGGIPVGAVDAALERVEQMRGQSDSFAQMPASLVPFASAIGSEPIVVGGIPVGGLPREFPDEQLRLGPNRLFELPEEELREILPLTSPQSVPLSVPINPNFWQWIGPGNIGGRCRTLVVNQQNPRIMVLGSVAGGIWLSRDSGGSWAPVSSINAAVNVSCLTSNPANATQIYCGTGEGFYNLDAFRGNGIYVSNDMGISWTHLEATLTPDFYWVNRLAISTSGLTLLAATRTGIWRSADAGQTFSPATLAGNQLSHIVDVRFHPTDAQLCIASGLFADVYYSEDAGQTWSQATGLPTLKGNQWGRIEIVYAKAKPDCVYAAVDVNYGQIFRSDDGGKSFKLVSSPRHFKSDKSSQGWYDNALWAGDPRREDIVVIGGIDLHRSTDGGKTFETISDWTQTPLSPHGDHHCIVSHPGYDGQTNRSIFVGGDGGLYQARDILAVGATDGWQELNNGLGITQFYGIGVNNRTGTVVGGTQDNGTLLNTPEAGSEGWVEIAGGDGGHVEVHASKDLYFGSYQYLGIHRSDSGGRSESISKNLPDKGLFVAPFILHPNKPDTLLAGGSRVWRSSNAHELNPNWTPIKAEVADTPSSAPDSDPYVRISCLSVAGSDGKHIWCGYGVARNTSLSGAVYRTDDGNSANPTWIRLGSGVLPNRFCTRIVIDPKDEKRVFALFGGYSAGNGYVEQNIWFTDDMGKTWKPIGGNVLPVAPAYDLAIHPSNSSVLYLGNTVGLFVSADAGLTWHPSNQGPTACSIFDLSWVGSTLYAGTHGRGVFKIDLSQVGPSSETTNSPTAYEGLDQFE